MVAGYINTDALLNDWQQVNYYLTALNYCPEPFLKS